MANEILWYITGCDWYIAHGISSMMMMEEFEREGKRRQELRAIRQKVESGGYKSLTRRESLILAYSEGFGCACGGRKTEVRNIKNAAY